VFVNSDNKDLPLREREVGQRAWRRVRRLLALGDAGAEVFGSAVARLVEKPGAPLSGGGGGAEVKRRKQMEPRVALGGYSASSPQDE